MRATSRPRTTSCSAPHSRFDRPFVGHQSQAAGRRRNCLAKHEWLPASTGVVGYREGFTFTYGHGRLVNRFALVVVVTGEEIRMAPQTFLFEVVSRPSH